MPLIAGLSRPSLARFSTPRIPATAPRPVAAGSGPPPFPLAEFCQLLLDPLVHQLLNVLLHRGRWHQWWGGGSCRASPQVMVLRSVPVLFELTAHHILWTCHKPQTRQSQNLQNLPNAALLNILPDACVENTADFGYFNPTQSTTHQAHWAPGFQGASSFAALVSSFHPVSSFSSLASSFHQVSSSSSASSFHQVSSLQPTSHRSPPPLQTASASSRCWVWYVGFALIPRRWEAQHSTNIVCRMIKLSIPIKFAEAHERSANSQSLQKLSIRQFYKFLRSVADYVHAWLIAVSN